MKTKIITLIISSALASCMNEPQTDTYEIYFPESIEANCGTWRDIQRIKNESDKSWADYMQLVIIYSAKDQPKDVVDHFFKKAIDDNEYKVCELIYASRKFEIDFFPRYQGEIDQFFDATFSKYEDQIISANQESMDKCNRRLQRLKRTNP